MSRGLGDVYKRQTADHTKQKLPPTAYTRHHTKPACILSWQVTAKTMQVVTQSWRVITKSTSKKSSHKAGKASHKADRSSHNEDRSSQKTKNFTQNDGEKEEEEMNSQQSHTYTYVHKHKSQQRCTYSCITCSSERKCSGLSLYVPAQTNS